MGLGDEQGFHVLAAKGHIGGSHASTRLDAVKRLAQWAEHPNGAKTCMNNHQISVLTQGHAIWPSGAARELNEHPDFPHTRVLGQEGNANDVVRARGRNIQQVFFLVQDQSIGSGKTIEEQIELTRGTQAVSASSRVIHGALPLVCEKQVPIGRKDQVIQAFETFVVGAVFNDAHVRRVGVKTEQSQFVVCHEKSTIFVNFEPIGLTIKLSKLRPLAFGVDFKNSALGDVHAIKVAFLVEGGTFKKRVNGTGASFVDPMRWVPHSSEFVGHAGEHFSLDHGGGCVH